MAVAAFYVLQSCLIPYIYKFIKKTCYPLMKITSIDLEASFIKFVTILLMMTHA